MSESKPMTLEQFKDPTIRGRKVYVLVRQGGETIKMYGKAGWGWPGPVPIVQLDGNPGAIFVDEKNVKLFYLELPN